MPTTLSSTAGAAHVAYHLFEVHGERLPDRYHFHENGLATPLPGGLAVLTGVHTGAVHITFEVLDGEPGPEADRDLDPWQDVVELSWECAAGTVDLTAPTVGPALAFCGLALPGGGSYRTRVHATGRDENVDGVADGTEESYRLTTWAAPPTPAVTYKLTDTYGAAQRGRT